VKALSILQPFADGIVRGWKPIENRSKPFTFRTPFPQEIVVHAGLGYWDRAPLSVHQTCKALGLPVPPMDGPRGALLGVVEFTDAMLASDLPAELRPWAFLSGHPLAEEGIAYWSYIVKPIAVFAKPVPWKGQLGIFDVPDEIVIAALAQGRLS
jgi:hypothetical protein